MRLNNLEGLKIEHGQSSEVWEKLNKSLTFTRYLQESSNLQLSLLQSSPRELGWHPSCRLRLPTQFSLTARVQRMAQQGCWASCLPLPPQSRRLRLSLAACDNAVSFSSMRTFICKGIFFWCRGSATHNDISCEHLRLGRKTTKPTSPSLTWKLHILQSKIRNSL